MTLKSGTYKVGDQTFHVDRSSMSSAALRKVEYDYNQARGLARKEAQQSRTRIQEEKKQRQRELTAQDEARQLKREQTLAARDARRGIQRVTEVEVTKDSFGREVYRDPTTSTTRLVKPTTGAGGVSSTFQKSLEASRGSLAERRQTRVDRQLQAERRKQEERRIRKLERESFEQFPSFEGKRPSEIIKSKKLLDPGRAKKATRVSDILRIGETSRLLPPLSAGGGGAIRLLHAVEKVEFGGGMAGKLRPKAAQQLGLTRIQTRMSRKAKEKQIQRITGLIPTPKVIPEPAKPKWEVVDPTTGETKTFRSQAAIDAYSTRIDQANRERQLRMAGTTEAQQKKLREDRAFDPAQQLRTQGLLPTKKKKQVEMEITTVQSATPTTNAVLPSLKAKKLQYRGLGLETIPIVGGLLASREEEVRTILKRKKADIRGGMKPATASAVARKRIAAGNLIQLPTLKPEPKTLTITERLWQADLIPGADLQMTPATSAFTLGAGGALSASSIGAAWTGASLLGGEAVEKTTGSAGLGLATALTIGYTGFKANKLLQPPKRVVPKTKAVKMRGSAADNWLKRFDFLELDDTAKTSKTITKPRFPKAKTSPLQRAVDIRKATGKQPDIGGQPRAAEIMLSRADPTRHPLYNLPKKGVGTRLRTMRMPSELGLQETLPTKAFISMLDDQTPRVKWRDPITIPQRMRSGSRIGLSKVKTRPAGVNFWGNLGKRGSSQMLFIEKAAAKTGVYTAGKLTQAVVHTPKPTTLGLTGMLVGIGATRVATTKTKAKKKLFIPAIPTQTQKRGTTQIPTLLLDPLQKHKLKQSQKLIQPQKQKLQQRQKQPLHQIQTQQLKTPLKTNLKSRFINYLPTTAITYSIFNPGPTPKGTSRRQSPPSGGRLGRAWGMWRTFRQKKLKLKGLSAAEFIGFGKKTRKKK